MHYQLYADMTFKIIGSVWSIDHCVPILSLNPSDENKKRKCFGWLNSKLTYSNEINLKIAKIDQRMYLLQEMKQN